jgi:hypothetical protein
MARFLSSIIRSCHAQHVPGLVHPLEDRAGPTDEPLDVVDDRRGGTGFRSSRPSSPTGNWGTATVWIFWENWFTASQ